MFDSQHPAFRRQPCRFFNQSRGCRYGDLCRYEHIRSSDQPYYSAQPSGFDRPQAPPGICKFFWSKGFCARGFSCSFKHGVTYTDSSTLSSGSDSDSDCGVECQTSAKKHIGMLLAADDLSSLEGAGSDAFRCRDSSMGYLYPEQTQDQLRLFLTEDFVLRTSRQIYTFSDLLLNATSANTSWSDVHGQLFLEAMASEKGRRLVQQLLVQENVSVGIELRFRTVSFLRGYIPMFQYLSSKFVIGSNLDHHVNSLYGVLDENIEVVIKNLLNCLENIMGSYSYGEAEDSSGVVIFGTLIEVFFQYLTRFKNVLAQNEDLGKFISKLDQWVQMWFDDINSPHPKFNDSVTDLPEEKRQFVTRHVKDRARLVSRIVEREQRSLVFVDARRQAETTAKSVNDGEDSAMLAALRIEYIGPGEFREDGPRHDNDFVDIRRVRVFPTEDELTCSIPPFLPGNVPNAPHPYPYDSIERVLDTQFRLLREEMIAPLRGPIQLVMEDMVSPNFHETPLARIFKSNGGRYSCQDGQHDVSCNVYTNAHLFDVGVDNRRGLVLTLIVDSPPGSARAMTTSERVQYWSITGNKRLMQGSLVALIRHRGMEIRTHLGIVSSKNEDIVASAREGRNTVMVKVHFDETSFLDQGLRSPSSILEYIGATSPYMFCLKKDKSEDILVESNVLFEAFRPFLESLQVLRRIPEIIPFTDYLPHSRENVTIPPPAYSLYPHFQFDLSCLLREDAQRPLLMTTTDEESISYARERLSDDSRLDSSQVDAIVGSLTREMSLVQGPPGTGKTFMGIELIRVLIHNEIGPILLVAVTNHALDHMLSAIVTSGITRSIVRLGGHSEDGLMKEFSIEARIRNMHYSEGARETYNSLKNLSESINRTFDCDTEFTYQSEDITAFLHSEYPDHAAFLKEPPVWISTLYQRLAQSGLGEEDGSDSWTFVQRNLRTRFDDMSLYEFWKTGADLEFIRSHKKGFRYLSDTREMEDSGYLPWTGMDFVPSEPHLDRSLQALLLSDSCDVWNFSEKERARVHAHWERKLEYQDETFEPDFGLLCDLIVHRGLRNRLQQYDNQRRFWTMFGSKVIGCTTSGAAKASSILQRIGPRVIIVEEAGQVLEAHIIANLFRSVQHLIMIGDPLQLRPSCNNYALSVDNPRGGKRYKFDVSLMERLSSSGTSMSQLTVQRRMRPEISSLIRNTLYPDITDSQTVLDYPHVQGMAKNVFFYSHEHPDDGGSDESVSRCNMHEVAVIKDIVTHLLRQGCYSSTGNIVILCSYIGQLARVKAALQDKMVVDVDERDQEALKSLLDIARIDGVPVKEVPVTQKIRVRTVDNFQGEEADIIILSLVRNSGKSREELGEYLGPQAQQTRPSIGFLKSENRTNVAISRARHGLYILGNASDFASQSKMWCSIITELERNDAVGDAIPIRCHRHPEYIKYISEPGQLPDVSPDGGCLRDCGERLSCGHSCPNKCHSDDEDHRNVRCKQPCPRLCQRDHPCPKRCSDRCGLCMYPIRGVTLPCGHVSERVPCHKMDDLSTVWCPVQVERKLLKCEHSAKLPCSDDHEKYICQEMCGDILPCCGNPCKAAWHSCRELMANMMPSSVGQMQHCECECKLARSAGNPSRL